MTRSMRFSFCLLLCWWWGPRLSHAEPHPTRLDQSSHCLECHADHASGDYVHPAVKRGCNSCHTIENREDVTYVELKSTDSVVCWECHQRVVVLHEHLPYKSGMCLRCHNPHSSANPRLLRAKVNDLCLNCHLQIRGRAASRYLPTIELTLNNSVGHPYVHHPVSGCPDPLRGGEMSCVSCHLAHGGAKLHQLKMGAEIPEDALNQNTETKDICQNCHLRLWGLEGNSFGKRKKQKNTANF